MAGYEARRLHAPDWEVRGYRLFDLSGIPTGAAIDTARIELYFSGVMGSATTAYIDCHRMLKYWREEEATWNERMSGYNWSTPGVGLDDVDADDYPTASVEWGTDTQSWKVYTITGLTQYWVDKIYNNYGVIFRAQDESSGGCDRMIYSSDHSTEENHPRIVITYKLNPLVTYNYDAQGRPIKTDYVGRFIETNTYDEDRDWLLTRQYKTESSTLLFGLNNTIYDAVGNLKKQEVSRLGQSLETYEYDYDDLDRLTQFKYNGTVKRVYDYDDNGNRKNSSCANSSYTYTYNEHNNKLHYFSYSEGGSPSTKTFTYDAAGRAESVNSTAIGYDLFSNMRSYGSDSYVYDANSQRMRKTENGDKTYYISSGLQVMAEFDGGASAPKAEYIYGIDGLVAKIDPQGRYDWYFKDHLGSTRQMYDIDMNVVLSRDYYPYGEDMSVSGSETNYLFSGKEKDGGTDLYYFGARYYDAVIGKWLVMDPADQYFSPYVYCNNNPLKLIDPTGTQAEEKQKEDEKKKESLWDKVKRFFKSLLPSIPIPDPNVPPTNIDVNEIINKASENTEGKNKTETVKSIKINAETDNSPQTPDVIRMLINDIVSGKSKDVRKLSPKETKALERGGVDIHHLKVKSGKKASRYDLYKDKKGNIYIFRRGGKGGGEYTGYNIKDFKK